jgi:hypothetical protein
MGIAELAIVIAFFAFIAAIGVVIDTIWLAIFSVMPQGKFRVLVDSPSSFGFLTTLGGFAVDRGKRILSYTLPGRRGTVPFTAIKGLEYRAQVKHAFLQELVFGLNLTDLLTRYRDTVEWFSIAAVTVSEERIPLYLGGQYMRREFLMTWYINLQATLLEKLGILRDEEVESRAVLEVIQGHLGNAKLI